MSNIPIMKIKRKPSFVKQFEKRFGGKWKYNRKGYLWQDDKNRYICKVKTCMCDDTCDHPPVLYLYGEGTPILINILLENLYVVVN